MASSLLTNSAAMTALQTLRSVSSSLSVTQNRISTGMRVATASDNSAYWSIATSMRADNAALSAVSDSLGLSAATVDTEYTALTAVIGSDGNSGLTKLQALLVEAKTAGIDRNKIQSEITQIQQDMKNTAGAATFNGVNWISATTSTPASTDLVSAFSRVGATPTISAITVIPTDYSLYNNSTATPTGYLDTATSGVSVDNMDISTLTDGTNTWSANPWNNVLKSLYSSYGYFANAEGSNPNAYLPSANAGPASEGQARAAMDALTLEGCRVANAAGITIYTVGFSVPSDPIDQQGQDLLKTCAGSSDRFFMAQDGDALKSAFDAIAKKLTKVRLTN